MNIGIKDVLYEIRFFFIPYLAVIIICVLIKLNFSKEQIYFAVNVHNYPWADTIAPYLTDLGNFWAVVVLAAMLALFNYARAFLLLLTNGITALAAQIIKHIFDAPRPMLYFKGDLSRIHFVKGVDMLQLHSMPSGHTISAFTTAVLFTYWVRKKVWGSPLLLIAVMVGYSRMYLSQHFFEDVCAGSAIGTLGTVLLICWLANVKFIKSPAWNRGILTRQ